MLTLDNIKEGGYIGSCVVYTITETEIGEKIALRSLDHSAVERRREKRGKKKNLPPP
ncbi:phosphoenolpyruvate synthase [Sesbania bispinosa]|nr:phosphoenolpyruvate synthase [Sesbania bispinosa]